MSAVNLRGFEDALEVAVPIIIRRLKHIALSVPEKVCRTGWLDGLQDVQHVLGQTNRDIGLNFAGSQRHVFVFNGIDA